jgi:hypothetical protein
MRVSHPAEEDTKPHQIALQSHQMHVKNILDKHHKNKSSNHTIVRKLMGRDKIAKRHLH